MSTAIQQCPYAIQITDVRKQYRLGQVNGSTLQGELASWWAKKRGKEDPNTKIGAAPRISGETFMALNGVTLTIKQGEAVGIIGKNGAGKSTLLKLLSRVTAPTEGEIDIYGRISSMLEVGTGFNGELTGRENVYMNGAILGMTKAEIDAKMEDIIAFSEVREFIDTPVKRYSSGMYVKLAFSVAAHLDSEIMIMDEVLAVGDMAFQKKCLDKMKEAVSAEGRTVLYVSHNMATIRQLCERCIVLDEGKVVYDGDVETAIEYYMSGEDTLKAHRDYVFKDYLLKNKLVFQVLSSDIDHIDCQYGMGEPVTVRLVCKSQTDLDNVHFRLQFVYKDGTRVGSSFSSSGFSIAADTETTVQLTLPTTELVPGQHLAEIAFYSCNDDNYYFINTIENGFCFEIRTPTPENHLPFWARNWGHAHLADMKLEVLPHES